VLLLAPVQVSSVCKGGPIFGNQRATMPQDEAPEFQIRIDSKLLRLA
jgi:hypothetical protein